MVSIHPQYPPTVSTTVSTHTYLLVCGEIDLIVSARRRGRAGALLRGTPAVAGALGPPRLLVTHYGVRTPARGAALVELRVR